MAAEPLADWISFDWLVVGAVVGGIVAGVLSARKREVTLLEYSVMSAAGLGCLVLWYWWPLLCVGGFLLPFSAAGVITIYVEQTRKRAEPDAGPNDEERG